MRTFSMAVARGFPIVVEGLEDKVRLSNLSQVLAFLPLASRRDLIRVIREGADEGEVVLYTGSDVCNLPLQARVIWSYDRSHSSVTGIIQPIEKRFQLEKFFDARDPVELSPTAFDSSSEVNFAGSAGLGLLRRNLGISLRLSSSERLVQLNIALEGANLGFWDWNTENDILMVNSIWAKMLGRSTSDIRYGKSFFKLLHPDDAAKVHHAISQYKKGFSRLYFAQFRMKHAEGHYLHIEAVGGFQLRTMTSGRKAIHLVGIHRDRSDEVEREEELKALADNATKASESKSRFLANASHEIRTPVHAIRNLIQMAVSEADPIQRDQYHHAVLEIVRGLSFVLDGLVDFASLDTVPLAAETSNTDITTLLTMTKAFYQQQAQGKGIEISLHLDSDLRVIHRTDQKLLAQILFGLVSNAVKFNENGLVTVSARLVKRSKRVDDDTKMYDTVEFEISDTGRGMDEAQIEMLFAPYSAHDDGRTRGVSGFGVGMAQVKACADALNAKLDVASELGVGTVCRLTLNAVAMPMNVGNEDRVEKLAFSSSIPIRKVLVVDDVEINRTLMRFQLENAGIEVFEAEDGLAVLALFKSAHFRPDLIFMDIQMPRMDGITCTRHLREDIGVDMPVVGITADATAQTEADGLAAGMNEVLFKPISVRDVVVAINERNKLL